VALQEARRRARTIRAKAIELQEERGITAGFIAVGMATWTAPGASRPPAAPVLLRSCVLKATGAAQQDFALDLGADVEQQPRHDLDVTDARDVFEDALPFSEEAGGEQRQCRVLIAFDGHAARKPMTSFNQ
jgi:hypothetical protein